jgi:hypothetical protein
MDNCKPGAARHPAFRAYARIMEKAQMADDPPSEDEVLRRMLTTKPKPHEKPPESSEARRRGRPIGVANKPQT